MALHQRAAELQKEFQCESLPFSLRLLTGRGRDCVLYCGRASMISVCKNVTWYDWINIEIKTLWLNDQFNHPIQFQLNFHNHSVVNQKFQCEINIFSFIDCHVWLTGDSRETFSTFSAIHLKRICHRPVVRVSRPAQQSLTPAPCCSTRCCRSRPRSPGCGCGCSAACPACTGLLVSHWLAGCGWATNGSPAGATAGWSGASSRADRPGSRPEPHSTAARSPDLKH